MSVIAFLILNYRTLNETIRCINTIENLDSYGMQKKIIVVDNASGDGSYEQLRSLYSGSDFVWSSNERNLGFSKANNIGFTLAKNIAGIEYLVVCNSDIEFVQKNFIGEIQHCREQKEFDVLGPDVYCQNQLNKPYKGHQSPAYPWEYSYWYTRLQIFENKCILKYIRGKKLSLFPLACIRIIRIFENLVMKVFYRDWRVIPHDNVALNGACFILAKSFIMTQEKLFDIETDFYYEELLLFLSICKNKYMSVYDPNIKVYHQQGRATNNITSNRWKRKEFIAKNMIKSANIYLKELEKRTCK